MRQVQDIEGQHEQEQKFAVQEQGGHDESMEPGVTKVMHDDEFVCFGNEKYRRSELVEAFGGTLTTGLSPPPKHNLGNPAPLGLSAFALTTFVLSLVNCGTRGVNVPNIVVGLAFFYGGLTQVLAGMFEIAVGNTFGGVSLSSYGGFWLSFAALYVDSFGIAAAYTDEKEFNNAVGLFMIGWFIFTFFLAVLTIKSTVAFFLIFFFLSITFLLLAIGLFTDKSSVTTAGGVFGLITAFAAWYNAFAGLSNRENSYITVKAIPLPDLQAKRD